MRMLERGVLVCTMAVGLSDGLGADPRLLSDLGDAMGLELGF